MLIVRVELWPFGKEEGKRQIAVAAIGNDGSGDARTGHYNFTLMEATNGGLDEKPEVWKRGRVENFPRLHLGPWDLLYRVLDLSVSSRNEKREGTNWG